MSTRSLRAYLQLALVVIVEFIYRSRTIATAGSPSLSTIVVRFVEIVLLLYPLVYFGVPLLALAIKSIAAQFAKERPAYPCPVCGYDIRETPHRCPECGTKLRWGQMP